MKNKKSHMKDGHKDHGMMPAHKGKMHHPEMDHKEKKHKPKSHKK